MGGFRRLVCLSRWGFPPGGLDSSIGGLPENGGLLACDTALRLVVIPMTWRVSSA